MVLILIKKLKPKYINGVFTLTSIKENDKNALGYFAS